jgi:5,10-methylene-tetrahydrofolate dehydrogenase/methenyl tetrahydrofolate cyclohydrolase
MTATLIDGKQIAQKIRDGIKTEVEALVAATGVRPGLAAVLVGDNPASATYVRMKRKACDEAGIASFQFDLPTTTTQAELDALIHDLNARPDVHGILVQLPLPKQLDEHRVISLVSLDKDVDGFNPLNMGKLAMRGEEPHFVPATPAGVLRLLDEMQVPLAGVNATVLGRSNIVGMPVALLLVRRDATVTVCHSKTKDLPGVIRRADVLIAAVGRAEMVRGDWVRPGAVVIDVGTNKIDDPAAKSGSRMVGDVAFEEASAVAGMITPVPGGVGPMTIAMLLENTLKSARRAAGQA